MSNPKITYRVYCFDSSRKIVTADFVQASSDAEAISKAEAKGFGSKCEVWEGRRLVAQLDGERRQA